VSVTANCCYSTPSNDFLPVSRRQRDAYHFRSGYWPASYQRLIRRCLNGGEHRTRAGMVKPTATNSSKSLPRFSALLCLVVKRTSSSLEYFGKSYLIKETALMSAITQTTVEYTPLWLVRQEVLEKIINSWHCGVWNLCRVPVKR
jgi:hypothetical protein